MTFYNKAVSIKLLCHRFSPFQVRKQVQFNLHNSPTLTRATFEQLFDTVSLRGLFCSQLRSLQITEEKIRIICHN